MKRCNVILPGLLFIFGIILPAAVYPCTTFVLRQGNHIVFGRNLDWITGSGLIMTNPRYLQKTALIDVSQNPITWTSKYGSITFNQVGRDLPYGGMNEAGLVVEHMTLDETVYPSDDNRHTISACQWIQYQLDNYSTVEEVIKSDTLLRIIDPGSKIHFLVCDKAGNVVSIEFINGKMVYHTGKDLPVEVLANSNYENSSIVLRAIVIHRLIDPCIISVQQLIWLINTIPKTRIQSSVTPFTY